MNRVSDEELKKRYKEYLEMTKNIAWMNSDEKAKFNKLSEGDDSYLPDSMIFATDVSSSLRYFRAIVESDLERSKDNGTMYILNEIMSIIDGDLKRKVDALVSKGEYETKKIAEE